MTRTLLVLTLFACGCDKDNLCATAEVCDEVDNDLDGILPAREVDGDRDGVPPCRQALWVDTINHTLSGASYGLTEDLTEEVIAHLEDRGVTVTWEPLDPSKPWSAKLGDVELLVLQGDWSLGALAKTDSEALLAWVQAGGSLLWIGQHTTESSCDEVNALPAVFGVTCPSASASSWEGTTSTFVSHPVTEGLGEITGLGGDVWAFAAPAEVLAEVAGAPFVAVVEHGKGRVVFVSDEWPFYDTGTNLTYDISAADNRRLVRNIWAWMVRE